jgi:hypothetical protein
MEAAANPATLPRVGSSTVRAKNSSESVANRTTSEYVRISCEYQTSTGATATKAVASSATRRSTRRRAARYATGTSAVPARADSERSATSPVPNTFAQTNATR